MFCFVFSDQKTFLQKLTYFLPRAMLWLFMTVSENWLLLCSPAFRWCRYDRRFTADIDTSQCLQNVICCSGIDLHYITLNWINFQEIEYLCYLSDMMAAWFNAVYDSAYLFVYIGREHKYIWDFLTRMNQTCGGL